MQDGTTVGDGCGARAQRRYIDSFPQPLLDDLLEKRWLPIVGAGLSHNARAPDGRRPPLWDALGRLVAGEITDGYEYSTPMDALSTYCHLYRLPLLAQLLAKILLVHKARPSMVHEALALLPFDMIVTTNIDFLLEKSYERTEYTRVLMDDTDLAVAPHDPGVVDILKIHGDVHNPEHLVVTEESYDEFLINYPILATFLANLLVERTAVLIGYSMEDPDLRLIWSIVRARLGNLTRPAFAIRVDASGTEIDRFKRRGISVINLDSRDLDLDQAELARLERLERQDPAAARAEARTVRYGEVLRRTFDELRTYQRERILAASRIHEESVRKQALIPLDHKTRLCLFAIPSPLHSFYKEFVFPEAVRFGFVPVVEEDIESPGGNISAEIDALLVRAAVIFVHADDTTPTTAYEMRLAKATGQERVFAVVQTGSRGLGDLKPSMTFEYADDQMLFEHGDELADMARTWFQAEMAFIDGSLRELPDQLLEEKASADHDFGPAVIAVYSALEVELSKVVEDEPGERPAPLWKLLREAKSNAEDKQAKHTLELDPHAWTQMEEWWKDMLLILHSGRKYLEREKAEDRVREVNQVIDQVRAATTVDAPPARQRPVGPSAARSRPAKRR